MTMVMYIAHVNLVKLEFILQRYTAKNE